MLATECYARDVLENYLLGRADDELSQAIEQHLESCSHCEETIAELDGAGDTLVRTLQIRRANQPDSVPDWVGQIAGSLPDQEDAGSDRSVPDSATDNELPDELGDYELLGLLGRGGMSVVFSARHKHLGREVALKVLLPTARHHSLSRERFTREMRAVGVLNHPSIIRATDAGEFQETLYLVMDRIDGVDLKHLVRFQGPLSVADACAIGVQVAKGLQHAHSQGIVHRDVKPSNVMLDHSGNVKILDFGLARMQSTGRDVTLQTTIGQLVGTLDYMSPEQASGSAVEARADIYSFGASLFMLLAGVPPHGRSQDIPIIEFLNRLATVPASRIDERQPGIPADLAELLDQMLQRDPQQRIDSVQEVARRLEPFAEQADLKALASRAPNPPTQSDEDSLESVKASLALVLPQSATGTANAIDGGAQVDAAGKQPPGWTGLAALGLAGASFFGLILLAFSLILKTPEGEFRVESDLLDDVTVEVVDEKDRVQFIAVQQGNAVTTLDVGRYRVRLNSPSDQVELSPKQIIVSNDKVAIVKVTRLEQTGEKPAAEKPLQRDPNVMMQAQIELEEKVAELKDAKAQREPDQTKVKSLEQRIAQLRALSQPIPNEPVYEGRTLADWTAQMRFEQQRDARKNAADAVIRLASKRPEDEKLRLCFEADARLARWSGQDLGYRLRRALQMRPSGSSSMYRSIDPSLAIPFIADQLISGDTTMQAYALIQTAYMRQDLRDGKWPDLFKALDAVSKSDSEIQRPAQLVLAVCQGDPDVGSKQLAAIDVVDQSKYFLEAMLVAGEDSRFTIAQQTKLDWTAHYIMARYSEGIEAIVRKEVAGPLSDYDWDKISDSQQEDINYVADRLLDELELAIETFNNPADNEDQVRATRFFHVRSLIDLTDLTGPTRERAIELLSRRIDQLVAVRDKQFGSGDSFNYIDAPAELAGAILLLGGTAPDSLKQAEAKPSALIHPKLAPAAQMIKTHESKSYRLTRYCRWFPYEILSLLVDQGQQEANAPNRYFEQWLGSSEEWKLSPSLVFDFGTSSPEAAELALKLLQSDHQELPQLLNRHPRWRKQVYQLLETTKLPAELDLALTLARKIETEETQSKRYHEWLSSDDPARIRRAISNLALKTRSVSVSFDSDLHEAVAKATDRLAEFGPLEASDIYYLSAVATSSETAPQYAADYLRRVLDPATTVRGLFDEGIYGSVEILMDHPDQVKELEGIVNKVIDLTEKLGSASTNRNLLYLRRLLSVLGDQR